MSGFESYRPGQRLHGGGNSIVVRGMRVPDLDAPVVPVASAAEQALNTMRAAEEAARREGYEEGVLVGRDGASAAHEAAVAATLEGIRAAMANAADAAAAEARRGAEELARMLIAALSAALPPAAARLAPETAARVARDISPILDHVPEVVLYVAPGFGPASAAAIDDARFEVREDAALPPGDARATWRGGFARCALATRQQAMAQALASLDLQERA